MKKNNINIELIGVGLPNRGAEFMARTVMSSLCRKDINFITQYPSEKSVSDAVNLVQAHPRSGLSPVDASYHTYEDADGNVYPVCARIDISGFSYGDFWGEDKMLKKTIPQIEGAKHFGIPYFVLPQSMGPFSSFKNTAIFAEFIAHSEMFCVRDLSSQRYVHDIFPWKASVVPDICFSDEIIFEKACRFEKTSKYGVIIPNSKMLQSNVYSNQTSYISDISKVVAFFNSISIEPIVLNHEGEADKKIVETLKTALSVKVYHPNNIMEITEIIKGSELLFTSRYHGMINGIKHGVPQIVSGWADKYMSTLSEYFENVPIVHKGFDIDDLSTITAAQKSEKISKKRVRDADAALKQVWRRINDRINTLSLNA